MAHAEHGRVQQVAERDNESPHVMSKGQETANGVEVPEDEGASDAESDPSSGSPAPPPKPTALEDALDCASWDQLRYCLRLLCTTKQHKDAISAHFLRPISKSDNWKRPRYELCRNCGSDYTVDENEKGDCYYHPGMPD